MFYFSYHNISIYEPCNYASNLAYYHVVTSICSYQDWSISDQYKLAMAQAFTCNGCPKKHSKIIKSRLNFWMVFLRHPVNIAKFLLRQSYILQNFANIAPDLSKYHTCIHSLFSSIDCWICILAWQSHSAWKHC